MVSTPRGRSTALLVVAILLLALNLRLSVNAVGTLLPQIRVDLGLTGAAAGLLLSLPPLVFAFAGIGTPRAAARLGNHRLVITALVLAVGGQALRALAGGTPALFVGTLVTLTGLAMGNVLMPGLIRQHFPDRTTTITAVYVTVLSIGATIGSGLTIPVQDALHGSWRVGLILWTAVAAVAVLPWLAMVFRSGNSTTSRRRSSVALVSLLRSPLAWTMAGFFGLQSAHVYVVVGWLGQVLRDAGISAVEMGALLASAPAIGIALSLAVPVLMRRQARIPALMVTFGICYLVGYLGLLLDPAGGAWVWMLFIGFGGGSFPTVLTLLVLRARTPDGVIALSAFTQCAGYLLGALAPLIFGGIHDRTHSWQPSLILMVALVPPMVLVGLRLARPRFLEAELREV